MTMLNSNLKDAPGLKLERIRYILFYTLAPGSQVEAPEAWLKAPEAFLKAPEA